MTEIDWDRHDSEKLVGHYIIAGLDGRVDDQLVLFRELVARGVMSPKTDEEFLEAARKRKPLPRPIIAAPG